MTISPTVKRLEREAHFSPVPRAEVYGVLLPFPHIPLCLHGDNFTTGLITTASTNFTMLSTYAYIPKG